MHSDGKKRLGRFIKGGSTIIDKVSLTEFSFDEIRSGPTIVPDNSRKSIIHAPYHEDAELETSIKPFKGIQQDLRPDHMKRPVMTPLDFSQDWRLSKHTGGGQDLMSEDDEFDYQDAMAHARAARKKAKKNADGEVSALENNKRQNSESSESFASDKITDNAASTSDLQSEHDPNDTGAVKSLEALQFPAQIANQGLNWNSMDVAGKAINDLGKNPLSDFSSEIRINPDVSKNADPKDSFIPSAIGNLDTKFPQNPEESAAEIYKQRMQEAHLQQADLKNMIEEEMAKGYRDGFRIGEEKAELQVRATSQKMFARIDQLVTQLNDLKKSMMTHVEENFFIVCQALAEALLKREFTIHPDAFNTVLERALSEAMEPGKVKIRIHPETFERIAMLGENSLLDSLIKDHEIPPGDFKIEGQMSVVDVNIGKLVSQLLSQADLRIFQTEEKAG